jgi:hypothetical protein
LQALRWSIKLRVQSGAGKSLPLGRHPAPPAPLPTALPAKPPRSEFRLRCPVEAHTVTGNKRGGVRKDNKAFLRAKEYDCRAVDVGVKIVQGPDGSGGDRVSGDGWRRPAAV